MTSQFGGFSAETFRFLDDLHSNNSKDWFEANKDRYQQHWKAPALELTNSLAQVMGRLHPPLKAEARINGTLRRINWDVRFSKDKSPYNARLHLIFWTGSHPIRSPAFHLVLSKDGLGYGAGEFGLEPKALKTLRQRIVTPKDRELLLNAIRKAEKSGSGFEEPDLKRLPSGFEADGDWEHLLRRKALVMRTIDSVGMPDWLFNNKCTENVMKIANNHMPLINWLAA